MCVSVRVCNNSNVLTYLKNCCLSMCQKLVIIHQIIYRCHYVLTSGFFVFVQEGIIQTPDVLNDPGVPVQLNPQQVIISSDDSQNSITATESIANISVLQLGDGSHSDHGQLILFPCDSTAVFMCANKNQNNNYFICSKNRKKTITEIDIKPI